jgi:hypothetical protein
MATEPLFDTGTPAEGEAAAAAETTDAGVSKAEGSALLQGLQALQARLESVEGSTAQTAQATAQAVQQLQRALEPDAGAVEPGTKFQEFHNDIDGYIQRQAAEMVKKTLGPHLKNQAEQTRESLLSDVREVVEGELGEGLWSPEFDKAVRTTLARLPVEMQASKAHVEAAVHALVGRLVMDAEGRKVLDEKRTAASKKREEADLEASQLMPRGRSRVGGSGTLTPDERTFLATLAKQGLGMSEKEYLDSKGRGRTESDWRKTA